MGNTLAKTRKGAVALAALSLAVLGTGLTTAVSPTLPSAQAYAGSSGAFTEWYNAKLKGGLVQAGNTVAYRDPANADNKAFNDLVPNHAELSKTFKARYTNSDGEVMTADSNGERFWQDGQWYIDRVSGGNFASDAAGLANSSSATLTVPAGSSVKKAILMWNGCDADCGRPVGAGGDPNGTVSKGLSPNKVKFRAPGGAWQSVTAQKVYRVGSGSEAYTAHADVTALVKGSGSYSAGDIAMLNNSYNSWGSWHLMVAYENLSEPLRQVVIDRGTASIGAGKPTTVTIPAVDFPKSGTFEPKVFMGASDGDPERGASSFGGDYFQINGANISQGERTSNGADPANSNFFTSLITDGTGARVTSRTPNWPNTYGLDIVQLNSPAGITRTSKGITLTGATTSEGVHPYVFALQVEVLPPALKITKDDSKTEVLPGEELEYTVTVKNTGEGEEPAATVKDTLPAELDFVSASDSGKLTGNTIQWPDFALEPGKEKTFTVKAKVKADVKRPGEFTNFATVAGYGDPDPKCESTEDASDHCTTDTDTIPGADVKILKEHVSGTTVKGETLTWKVTVGNDGKADARDVVVTDTLPEAVDPATLKGTDPSQGEWVDGQWLVGTLKAGESASITLTATVATTVPAGQDAGVNEARVTSPDDPTPTEKDTCQDNATLGEDTDNCDVVPLPKNPSGLSLTKDDGVEVVEPEQKLTYTIEVTNEGPGDESAATVTDQFPAELDFVSASDGGTFDAETGLITFKDLAIKAGQKKALTVVATVKKGIERPTSFTNYAAVTGTDVPPLDPTKCEEGDKRCDTDTDKTVPEPAPTSAPSDPPATPADPVEPPLANTGMSPTTGIITGLGTLALVGGALAAGLARRHRKEAAERG